MNNYTPNDGEFVFLALEGLNCQLNGMGPKFCGKQRLSLGLQPF